MKLLYKLTTSENQPTKTPNFLLEFKRLHMQILTGQIQYR